MSVRLRISLSTEHLPAPVASVGTNESEHAAVLLLDVLVPELRHRLVLVLNNQRDRQPVNLCHERSMLGRDDRIWSTELPNFNRIKQQSAR